MTEAGGDASEEQALAAPVATGEREAALRDVLRIISQSRSDETPAFNAILETAARLCASPMARLHLLEPNGTQFRLAATWGDNLRAIKPGDLWDLDPVLNISRAILDVRTVHDEDMRDSDLYRQRHPTRVQLVDDEGIRTQLNVPLINDGKAIGCLTLSRREVQAFDPDQVALVEMFAAQAVIAIENVRQFRELQTRLDREGATREILEVISRSRDDEQPVFDVILKNAMRLCDAPFSMLFLGDGVDCHPSLVTHRGARSRWVDEFNTNTPPNNPERSIISAAVIERRVVRISDMKETEPYRQGKPNRVAAVELEGVRSVVVVPLLRGSHCFGCICLYRRVADPFNDDEIALVETFAAQAVIAIENVRQFRELQARLEREAASRAILQVISHSRDDDAPVFDVILENAARLCDAPDIGLHLLNEARTHTRLTAVWGPDKGVFQVGEECDLSTPQICMTAAIKTAEPCQIGDLTQDPDYLAGEPISVRKVDEEGVRTHLSVPLVKDGIAFGCLNLNRYEVRPFTAAEIALIETFAAQAVIAIENVRQFRELQARLEREAASREILGVISQSRDDEQPVFDVILENAARLCGSPQARLHIVDEPGTHFRLAAAWGDQLKTFQVGEQFPIDLPQIIPTAIRETRTIHVEDLADDRLYAQGDPVRKRLVDVEGIRTYLTVPLASGGKAFGSITLSRRERSPFAPHDIKLVETFAAQAVIAIENVRQFRELQSRLEREAATREILQVISQCHDDAQPVFETIVRNASRLCHAPGIGLHLLNEERSHSRLVCSYGPDPGVFPVGMKFDLAEPMPMSTAMDKARTVHIPDMTAEPRYLAREPDQVGKVEGEGVLTFLSVPLLKNNVAFGCINLSRYEVKPFVEAEIALIETFAAQAVIAIENVRQFRAIQTANCELETRLEREAATREILQVISQSRDDEQPVFDVILKNAARLCGSPQAGLITPNEAGTHAEYTASWGPQSKYFQVGVTQWTIDDPIAITTAIRESRVVHIPDLMNDALTKEEHPSRLEIIAKEGIRTVLAVPLLKDGKAIGCVDVYRLEVDPFTDDEIALLQSFAAQAVIAIENVQQFRELQTRLEREAASREILGVISQSRDDDQPVFDVILENASRLCKAPLAFLAVTADDGEHAIIPAHRGARPAFADTLDKFWEPIEGSVLLALRPIAERRVIRQTDISDDDLYRNRLPLRVAMVEEEGIRSILAVPLMHQGDAVGALVLYRREINPFTDDEVALVEGFAAQAVIAIENVRQFKALEARTEEVQALNAGLEERVEEQVGEIERMGRLKRFLSPAVADAVVSSGEQVLKSHRSLLGVLFCDIRGFTAFCETAEPEETIEVLQTYHEEMGRLIAAHGAGVDHRMGDGIMVLFNDPLPCDDPAGGAYDLALAMHGKMKELCTGWRRMGHRLGFGAGISLGYATVGMVGSEGRFDYTASGTAVNLAARLCDAAEDGEILLSPRAFVALEDRVAAEPAGELTLKGIGQPVEVQKVKT